jgi:hypothetical protein
MPEMEAVLTITPPPWRRKIGTVYLMPRKTLVKVTARVRFQSSMERDSRGIGTP